MAIVTAELAKQYLQISGSVEDDIIDLLIESAEEYVTAQTGIYLHDGDGSVTEDLDGGAEQLWPNYLPIRSITSVVDLDASNVEYVYENTDSRILRTTKGALWPKGNKRFRVTYTAGYSLTDVPTAIRHIVLDLVYRAHRNRGGKTNSGEQGLGYSWQDLAGSDIAKRINSVSMRRFMA